MRKLHLRKIANVSDLSVGGSFPQAIAEAGVISFTGNRGFFHCSCELFPVEVPFHSKIRLVPSGTRAPLFQAPAFGSFA